MFAAKDTLLTRPSGSYQISRSVRLRKSASGYFNKTYSNSPTSRTTMTMSFWVKRGTLSDANVMFIYGTSGNFESARFNTDNTLSVLGPYMSAQQGTFTTTQVFRDPSAWYHIVVVYDTTNATAANRIRLYVNGNQVTSFSSSTNSNINNTTTEWLVSGLESDIGNGAAAARHLDGYMTEINVIDGQALTPSSFGETNAVTGVWQPKKYGGTYGTNGFYLNFSDNSAATAAAIGKDSSGNGNNWTPNNISITAGATYDSMLDVPTPYADGGNGRGNYCVLNPVNATSAAGTSLSNGNLRIIGVGTGNTNAWIGTLGTSSGKWYYEVVMGENNGVVGISQTGNPNAYPGGDATSYGYSTAVKYNNNISTAYGASLTGGDIVGVAYDLDAGTITFYKNNVSQGQAFSGLSGIYFPAVRAGSTGAAVSVNFGQRPFSYTPPTGFVALNTQNLPTPTISNGASYMAATTYTGTGSALTVANTVGSASFQPDLVWVKGRSGATDHAWYDAVRGVQKQLESNTTTAETTETTGLTAFGTTGFTIGALAQMNTSAATYVGWQWNAGGSTVTNTSGSISAQVRANTTAGFSVVTYTGTGSGTPTIGHGLGVAPSMVIAKTRSTANGWLVYHQSLGATQSIILNGTNAASTQSDWGNTTPTSTVFYVNGGNNNISAATYVAYCFAAVAGYSAFGKYTGNGSTDGPFVYLGFRPRFVMVKRTDTTGNWIIWDSARDTYNATNLILFPNLSNAESTAENIDFLSNGFKLRVNSAGDNASGGTYIYAAFAENPFKLSLAR